jgi:hypothetical protein
MNILSLSRQEVQGFIDSGLMRKEALTHYDICKAMAEGKKQEAVAEDFDTDDRHIRWVKSKKCPDCSKNRLIN